MKLNELLGVKKFNLMTHDEVIKWTAEFGKLKPLGDGANAIALTDGTSVYKFWMVDSAYEDFVEYCMKNQNNPFLPKFKSKIKKIPAFFLRDKSAPDYVRYVKMEKLESADATDKIFKISEHSDEEITLGKIESFMSRLDYDANRTIKKIELQYGDISMSDEVKLLVQTLCDIGQIGDVQYHFTDMTDNNIMRRGDQMVILDPLANGRDVELNDRFIYFLKKSKSGTLGKVGHHTTKTVESNK